MTDERGNDIDEADEARRLQENKQIDRGRDYKDPIKQYVRRRGWVPAARSRLEKTDPRKEHLKYFTLCGKLAIDVLWFYASESLLFKDGKGYPEVVFCEHFPDEYEKINRRLGRTSGIIASFEDLILNKDSEESKYFYSEAPFDVYNLDFTGGCFPEIEPPFSRTLDSIVTLINDLGQQENPSSFDIFFTFRAQRSEENRDAVRELRRNLNSNREAHPRFKELIEERFGEELEGLVDNYHDLLLLTLPKYLGRIGCEAGFRVECTHRFYYPRPSNHDPRYHIISFGLSFDWIEENRVRNRDLLQPVPSREILTSAYLEMMESLLVSDIPNVDSIRFSREGYRNEIESLLAACEE